MPNIQCPILGCVYTTGEVDAAIAAALLLTHNTQHQNQRAPTSAMTRKPDRPIIDVETTDAQWAFFKNEWADYKKAAGLQSAQETVNELRYCCTSDLRRTLFDFLGSDGLNNLDEEKLLKYIESSAVRSKSSAVHRKEFHSLHQDADVSIRKYVAQLKSKATHCQYSVECPTCQAPVSYAMDMVMDQMIAGIYDGDIQTDLLARASQLPTFQTKFEAIEALEKGRTTKSDLGYKTVSRTGETPPPSTSAAKSEYQRQRFQKPPPKFDPKPPLNDPSARRHFQSSTCSGCGQAKHGPRNENRRRSCPARAHSCKQCGITGHLESICYSRRQSDQTRGSSQNSATHPANAQSDPEVQEPQQPAVPVSNMFSVETSPPAPITPAIAGVTVTDQTHADAIPHVEWIDGAFKPHRPRPPPRLTVTVQVLEQSHASFGRRRPRHWGNRPPPVATEDAISDTGAQTCTAGYDFLDKLGVPLGFLLRTTHASVGIDRQTLKYAGCVLVSVTAGKYTTKQAVYITEGVQGFYLSHTALIDLHAVGPDYPIADIMEEPPSQTSTTSDQQQSTAHREFTETTLQSPSSRNAECECPRRTHPPPKPTHIPFAPTDDNRAAIEDWLLKRYQASAFNTCEHQPLPVMSGRPLDVHFVDGHKAKAYHTPIPVAHHWKADVKAALDRDVRIGTIEPVPQGTPVEWCARMVVVPKHDNSPRRTVDLQDLNRATLRETHHTVRPYNQVSVVPPHTRKTILDAWNGYHSLPLAPSARDATTFITEWGRYRYLRAPQGFHAAGDGYTRRFDDITVDVRRKAKCVDDTLLWDQDIESAFWHVIDYLDLCSANGIVFNPTKFRFASREADFAGFTLTESGIKPSIARLESIQDFPTPTDITGVRSWFGLLQQISYATAISPKLQPFRDLLEPGRPWYWDDVLDNLFRESKTTLIKEAEMGVRAFQLDRPTLLASDWCKDGLGFVLLQKHCSCAMDNAPSCCNYGWQLVLPGSRFTTSAESRYAPIEGEALALVEALEKCRMFTLGCPNLLVVTDHKPLVKIFGDKSLADIRNPRLYRLKERSLFFQFTMKHVPGSLHLAADALSRYPARRHRESTTTGSRDDGSQAAHTAAMSTIASLVDADESSNPLTMTQTRIRTAVESDPTSKILVRTILAGFPATTSDLPAELQPYWNQRHDLTVYDGIPMIDSRVIVPCPLRSEVLDMLHAAHQGEAGMKARARTCVFWPNINNSIHQRRAACQTCNTISPSNPREPPQHPTCPEYPFQLVCADYFHLAGHTYLLYVDRYSGWINIHQASGDATAKSLISSLRLMFTSFGVPDELATDGGQPFPSLDVRRFLQRWGVTSRLSSAYYPRSNGRAEVGVKTAKRILRGNIGPAGRLDSDRLTAALLQYHNTPLHEIGLSPSALLYGRTLRDTLPFLQRAESVRPEWKDIADKRELAMAKRNVRSAEALQLHAHELRPLAVGDCTLVQNQTGPGHKRWEKTGTIVEVLPNHQYSVRMHGSGRYTLRNRRFLRKIAPVHAPTPPTFGTLNDFPVPRPMEVPVTPLPSSPVRQSPPSPRRDQPYLGPDPDTSSAPALPYLPAQIERDEPDRPSSQRLPPASNNIYPDAPTQQRPTRSRRPPRTLSPTMHGPRHGETARTGGRPPS